MDVKKFRELLSERIKIADTTDDEWDDGIENVRKQMIEVLTEDVHSAVKYLKEECTADEYSWISEILDDIVLYPGMKDFLLVYKDLMQKFPEECKKYSIQFSIEFAEEVMEDEQID